MAIKLVVLDIDGIMNDGKMYNEKGETVLKLFNDLDFTSIKGFLSLGVPVVFLTGHTFNQQMAKLRNIPFYHSRSKDGILNKEDFLPFLENEYDVNREDIVYLADDRFDTPLLKLVGWAFCPSNSPRSVKEVCRVLKGKSGENLVSEMLDWFIENKILNEPDINELKKIDAIERASVI